MVLNIFYQQTLIVILINNTIGHLTLLLKYIVKNREYSITN